MDVSQIKHELSTRTEAVCRLLLPNGSRRANEWCVGSIAGEEGQSLKIHLTGNKAGIWSDFAAGSSGDILDLYRAVKGGSLGEAVKWAKEYLGIIDPEFHRMPAKTYRKPEVGHDVRPPQNGALDYLKRRGLEPATIKAFQLGEQSRHRFRLNGESAHDCAAVVFPFKAANELKFVKYLGVDRPEGKKLIDAAAGCEAVLFGWQAVAEDARFIVITEGEINALSWYQYGFAALATPFGAGKGAKHNWIASDWERLDRFERIYLNFDQDNAGREAIGDLVGRLGRHRCLIVPPMPDGHKDINDCLIAGLPAAGVQSLLDASKSDDPKELRSATEFTEDVVDRFYPPEGSHQGVKFPFEGFADKFSFRRGELTVMTGARGHGKTQALNWIHAKAMEQGERVCIASFEMPAKVLLQRLVRQLTTKRQPNEEYIRRVMAWMSEKLWIYDHVGTVDRKRVLEVFEYAYRRYGVTYFVVDSLMKCRINGDDYNSQDLFVDDLDTFSQRLQVHTTLVAHARKGISETAVPTNDEVKGSGGITDKAWNVLSIWRNKAKEIASQKLANGLQLTRDEEKAIVESDAIWSVDKQREGDGWIGQVGLGFDPDSQQFVKPGSTIYPIVPFNWLDVQAAEWNAEDEIRF